MNEPSYQTRRANLEDLGQLRQLWQHAQWPVADLEKHLTEFQVAAAADGTLLGCLGLRIESRQGLVYGHTARSPEKRAALLAALWSRVQSVAHNHGLVRLWIREEEPFWTSLGFRPADAEVTKKLPAPFGDPQPQWLTLQLREEVSPAVSVEREFEMFRQAQREMSQRTLRQARALRVLAGLVAVVAFGLSMLAVWYLLRHLPGLPKP